MREVKLEGSPSAVLAAQQLITSYVKNLTAQGGMGYNQM